MNAKCIGCSCTDHQACPEGCSWLAVDYDAGKGVCSSCPSLMDRWGRGYRSADVGGRPQRHEWDDDACCIHCGFDGAEWHWWRHHTYEGKSQPEARMPPCEPR